MLASRVFAAIMIAAPLLVDLSCVGLHEQLNDQNYGAVCSGEQMMRLRQVAEQGAAATQNSLGKLYQDGRCGKRDYAEAAKWYRRSAEQGNADAQFNLGMMYSEGLDVPHDYSEAARFFNGAAEQGHSKAQYALGSLYATGRGVTKDNVRAYKWIRVSAPKENEHVQDVLKTLRRSMTPIEIEEAENQAEAWVDTHAKSLPRFH